MNISKERHRCLGCMEMYLSFDEVCPYCGYANGAPPKEMYHLAPGTWLEQRYLIGRVLGFGGFGITYVGWDDKLERKVAVKEYLPGDCSTRIPGSEAVTVFEGEKEEQYHKGFQMFMEEGEKLMKFQMFPAIVNVFDCLEANGTAYLIMEYLDGCTLREVLEERKRLDIDETLRMMLPVMNDLEKIHEAGLIHRDIAPDNIFITKENKVKLLDFGSARYVTLTHSKSLSVIIKAGYAPPEQYQSHGRQGSWTDVYGLAATMYRMLTGIPPEDAMERMEKDRLELPSKNGADLLKNQEIALMNALNTAVDSRTATMGEFKAQLFSEGTLTRQKAGKRDNHIGKGLPLFWMGALAVLCFSAGMGVLFFSGFSRIGGTPQKKMPAPATGLIGNYRGFLYDEVVEEAKKNGIILEIVNTSNEVNGEKLTDDTIGKILSQMPEAGTFPKDWDGKLSVVVSAGTKKSKVGNYGGYSLDDVKEMMQKEHILLQEGEEFSGNIIKGYVAGQSFPKGEEVPAGSAVVVNVSAGEADIDKTKTFQMPEMSGKTFGEALQLAEKKGFYVGISEHRYSAKEKKGTVCGQSVPAKTESREGTEVFLIISDGPEQKNVPNVIGREQTDAEKELQAQKLKVKVVHDYNDSYGAGYEKGIVMEQSKKGGTTVDEGTEVTLTISRGSEPTTQERATRRSSVGRGSKKTTRNTQKKKRRQTKEYKKKWTDIKPRKK